MLFAASSVVNGSPKLLDKNRQTSTVRLAVEACRSSRLYRTRPSLVKSFSLLLLTFVAHLSFPLCRSVFRCRSAILHSRAALQKQRLCHYFLISICYHGRGRICSLYVRFYSEANLLVPCITPTEDHTEDHILAIVASTL